MLTEKPRSPHVLFLFKGGRFVSADTKFGLYCGTTGFNGLRSRTLEDNFEQSFYL